MESLALGTAGALYFAIHDRPGNGADLGSWCSGERISMCSMSPSPGQVIHLTVQRVSAKVKDGRRLTTRCNHGRRRAVAWATRVSAD